MLYNQFWRFLQAIKYEIRLVTITSIDDGADTLFWLDYPRLGRRLLRFDFFELFAIYSDPTILVVDAALHGTWDIPFRRNFDSEESEKWELLRESLPLSLSSSLDKVEWVISPSLIFTVRSAYRALFRGPILTWTSPLWKGPMPLKIKIFVWQLLCDRLPSGVDVARRHGPANGMCP